MDSEFYTFHRGRDTDLVLRFKSSGTVLSVPVGVLPDISNDHVAWPFVPRSDPLDTEDEDTVNLRNIRNC